MYGDYTTLKHVIPYPVHKNKSYNKAWY